MRFIQVLLSKFGFLIHNFKGESVRAQYAEAVQLIVKVREDAAKTKAAALTAIKALSEDIEHAEQILAESAKAVGL